MDPDHQETVDKTFDLSRELISNSYNLVLEKDHLAPQTIGALGLYLSIAIADSDELLATDNRLRIAKEFVREDVEFDHLAHARAIGIGQEMACRAFRHARRIATVSDTLSSSE